MDATGYITRCKHKPKNQFHPDKYLAYTYRMLRGDTTNRMQLHMQDEDNALSHANRKAVKKSKGDSALEAILSCNI